MTGHIPDPAALYDDLLRCAMAQDVAGMRALLPGLLDTPYAAQALNCLGYTQGTAGPTTACIPEGIEILQRAYTLADNPALQAKIQVNISGLHGHNLNFPAALAAAEHALSLNLELGHLWRGWAYYAAAEALISMGRDTEAEVHYFQSLTHPIPLHLREYVHAALANLAASRGDAVAFREHSRMVHDPVHTPALCAARARWLLHMGDPATALPLARQAVLGLLANKYKILVWPKLLLARQLHDKVATAVALQRNPGSAPVEHATDQDPLTQMLESLTQTVEMRAVNALASVFLLDGHTLRLGAAPSMTPAQRAVLDGLVVGRNAAVLTEAIQRRERVEAGDVFSDPQWESARHLAEQTGLKAAMIAPIWGTDGTILGTCGLSYTAPQQFTDTERTLVEQFAKLAAVAIESRRTEDRLREQQRLYRVLADNASDIISVIRPDGVFSYVSPACETLLGYAPAELEGTNALDLIWHEDMAEIELGRETVGSGLPASISCRARARDGGYLWLETLVRPIMDENGSVKQFVACSRDITARKRVEEQLAHQAFHDPLTGLPNRVAFMERLRQAMARSTRHKTGIAVLFLDLDNFKVINDTLGHEVGDRLLCGIAERLRTTMRAEDTPARFGGDEFTILLEDPLVEEHAARVAERVANVLSAPFALVGREIYVTFSIGISRSTPESRDMNQLLRNADVAMYAAKRAGKARYAVYHPSMGERGMARLEMETDLRGAVARRELVLHYQPLVDLHTGQAAGVEALVRWQHPERGLIPPLEFIPLAEETGLIIPISRWVTLEACRQMARWQASSPTPLTVSVNLSRRQFQQPNLVQEIAEILRETGLNPASLQLEVTESAMMEETEAAIAVLHQLKALGVKIAMDDFGTGYSSFSYLKRFPIDVLKIDRSFVSGLGSGPEDGAILGAMLTLARALHLKVVAEGVETQEHGLRLLELGCDLGQGYYYSRPMPVGKLSDGRLPEKYPLGQ